MRYLEMYKEVFSLVLNKIPSDDMIINYYTSECIELQSFCVNNLKENIHWSTGIGIIEGVEKIIKEAVINGNI